MAMAEDVCARGMEVVALEMCIMAGWGYSNNGLCRVKNDIMRGVTELIDLLSGARQIILPSTFTPRQNGHLLGWIQR